MTGVAIEQMLELWCVELRQVKAHLNSLFAHPKACGHSFGGHEAGGEIDHG